MKFVLISDTQGFHREVNLPPGDVLVHAGDITDNGTADELSDFLDWFAAQSHAHKVFIGGNHDFFLDENPMDLLEMLPPGVTYLHNEGCRIGGLHLWGSPVSPDLVNWAFGKYRAEMEVHWQHVPSEVDILITHTPPFGILDQSSAGIHLGCEALLKKVQTVRPKYHIFGHVHASYGVRQLAGITYINASLLHSTLGPVHPPLVMEWS